MIHWLQFIHRSFDFYTTKQATLFMSSFNSKAWNSTVRNEGLLASDAVLAEIPPTRQNTGNSVPSYPYTINSRPGRFG